MIRIAILDLYEGFPNQGMRCLREIIRGYASANSLKIIIDEFDVRLKLQVPDLSYDIYLSSGGPGSPLTTIGSRCEDAYFRWLRKV